MAKELGYTAILGDSTEYSGRLSFKGTVRIDGKFSGDIESDGKLVLGKGACLEGTVKVAELVVHGSVSGDIYVSGRSILHQTARVAGNIITKMLIMEEGAELNGSLQMGAMAEQFIAEKAAVGTSADMFMTEIVKQ